MAAKRRKSKFFESLAHKVASGVSVKDAALEVGCALDTAYKITGKQDFKNRVSEIRTSLSDSALGRLTDVAKKAVDTLEEVMEDVEAKPSDRISAAKAVLAMLGPTAELVELRQRINELERQLSEQEQ